MKILTAAEMREVDRVTIERGIPGLVLMENAGSRVVDFLLNTFAPLGDQSVVVVCGKGNNGGDGFVVARQLFTRKLCRELTVFELFPPGSLSGDARENRRMLDACGCPVQAKLPFEPNPATIVVDAILGTGLTGPATGPAAQAIDVVNNCFPVAKKVAVDIPSGLPSEATVENANSLGPYVRADYTVTFTAPKSSQCLPPTYQLMGKLKVVPIGSPREVWDSNPNYKLNLTTPDDIRHLFAPRRRDSNKGLYGHVAVIGGSFGKSGAPAMVGVGAYRAGAGLVTVAVPSNVLPTVAGYYPELMTEAFDQGGDPLALVEKKTVLALGPGLGTSSEAVALARRLYEEVEIPAVVDADALNALAGALPRTSRTRIFTPHPGEMGRLIEKSVKEVQADRLGVARRLAEHSGATVVLKGDRTVIAFPNGSTWVNPTGSPALAKGGTGDILTGIIAGLVAQHPTDWQLAVVAGVWLHGRCGELAGEHWGEESTMATDILQFLPAAMNEVRPAV